MHVCKELTCARSHDARVQSAALHVCKEEPWCTCPRTRGAHVQRATLHMCKALQGRRARTRGARVQGTAVRACKELWCTCARSCVCVCVCVLSTIPFSMSIQVNELNLILSKGHHPSISTGLYFMPPGYLTSTSKAAD